MAEKRLVLVVEGTAALGAYWKTIVSDYLDKIIRCFCGSESTGQNLSGTNVELSLVVFNAHGPYSACLVQRYGWTRDMDVFFQCLAAIPFSGGCFSEVEIAEGLAEALMMLSTTSNGQKHCILVAASNPYSLPTPAPRQPVQKMEQGDNAEAQSESRLSEAETVAKSFSQCCISLSVISPKQLPKLRAIYSAGKCNPRAANPAVDNAKNPHFLISISENFMEARTALSCPGVTNLATNHTPLMLDTTFIPPISGPAPTTIPSEEFSRDRYKWTNAEEEVLIETLLEMKARGRKLEKQFLKEVLTEIATSIQLRTGRNPDPKNITNKIKVWRGKYAEVKQLLNMSGFGWDDVTKMVTASEELWNGLKNTKFYKYRSLPVKNFRELAQFVSDDAADGSLAMSGGKRSEANLEMTKEEFVESTYENASHGRLDDIDEGNIPEVDVRASQPSIPTTTTISAHNRGSRKRRSSDSREIKKTLVDIASVVHALVECVPESSTSLFNRVSTCVMSLPYVPEELKFDVIDFICGDEKMASRFIGINDDMKKRWLDRHLHLP